MRRHICAQCADRIVPGEHFFTDGWLELHDECMEDWLREEKGITDVAWQYGFVRDVKEEFYA